MVFEGGGTLTLLGSSFCFKSEGCLLKQRPTNRNKTSSSFCLKKIEGMILIHSARVAVFSERHASKNTSNSRNIPKFTTLTPSCSPTSDPACRSQPCMSVGCTLAISQFRHSSFLVHPTIFSTHHPRPSHHLQHHP